MTAWGNIDLAVESMKRGARDFIQKPWENERLLSLIRVHAELRQAPAPRRQLELENRLLRADGMPEFVAAAPAMQPVLDLIAQVGPSDATCSSPASTAPARRSSPGCCIRLHHVPVCRSSPSMPVGLPEGTFESEIFGHVKGAFTDARTDRIGRFELANNGTLFLDEIANVPLRQQAKLLRVLETGELERVGSSQTRRVDVRVLSATPTRIWAKRPRRASSAKTCSSASTPSKFICPRYATAAKTFRFSPRTFSTATACATASRSPASLPPPCRP